MNFFPPIDQTGKIPKAEQNSKTHAFSQAVGKRSRTNPAGKTEPHGPHRGQCGKTDQNCHIRESVPQIYLYTNKAMYVLGTLDILGE